AALLVAVPMDIAALRQRDRAAALRWRYAVREALAGALAAGHRVVHLTRDGYYLLERSCG
ncbi:MAG TPA: GNAT family N-acetyltransferase, partial [Micromonosporaceae bacterium]|nr:GNAT family N-acetyltransferase [Micromonosporaceae bacterium]